MGNLMDCMSNVRSSVDEKYQFANIVFVESGVSREESLSPMSLMVG